MSNTTQPEPPLDLPTQDYYHLVHTLTRGLPPPLADTQEALLTRNQAAIAQVAALLPVNANEAGLAAQCIAARAQAEDVMRLLRKHDGDIGLIIKLNAQYAAMSRTSLAAHGHLLRAQAVRHKREQSNPALNADEWTQHVAARSMHQVLDAGPAPAALAVGQSAPAPEEPPAPAPEPVPVAQPPAPALAAAPPPAAAEEPPAPAPVSSPTPAAEPLAPAAPAPPEAPRPSRRMAIPAESDEPPRNLPTEADHYALVYPNRAREIRHYGGLPPDCSFGPPDDDLVRAIVTGTTPALRVLDGANAAAAQG